MAEDQYLRDERLRPYEASFLLTGEEAFASVVALMQQHDLTITEQGPVKQIALAYPIRKRTTASFSSCRFTALPENIAGLEAALRGQEAIVRFLIITAPPAAAQQPARRDYRDRPLPQREPQASEQKSGVLSNQELEQKIEEILK